MKTSFELVAEFRETQGKGASRRLRHEGKVPAILYGGHAEARALTLSHQKLSIMLDNERFYSTILSLKVGDETQAAILKDVQRHPFKNAIVHIDFQRVEENEKIRISIPLHFKGEAVSPGVKSQGGIVSHMRNRSRSLLPAEGSAGIHRSRPFRPVAQREHPLVAAEDTGGRAAGGSGEGRCGGRGHPQPACGRAGTDGGGGGARRQRQRRRRRRRAPAASGDAAKKAEPARRPKPRRNRQRKTRRSNPFTTRLYTEGPSVAGGPCFFKASAG